MRLSETFCIVGRSSRAEVCIKDLDALTPGPVTTLANEQDFNRNIRLPHARVLSRHPDAKDRFLYVPHPNRAAKSSPRRLV